MSTEQPATITVPTEMSRADGFIDGAVIIGAGLAAWWLALRGVPVWLFVPVLACLGIFVLTGEPAGDVQIIGAFAAGLRSKLGLRRAHEWALAFGHYTAVKIWPAFKHWSFTTWQTSRLRSRTRTLTHSRAWQRTISASRINMRPRWSTRLWRLLPARPVTVASPLSDGLDQ